MNKYEQYIEFHTGCPFAWFLSKYAAAGAVSATVDSVELYERLEHYATSPMEGVLHIHRGHNEAPVVVQAGDIVKEYLRKK